MSEWSKDQIIYQIYPKSFNDSNNDGIGDINGITQKIPYLRKLGITTIWLNPIYLSPQVDNGYDVSDYYKVDPTLGTMADVQNLIQVLHQNQMYIIFDFVLNHTSNQHPWFKEAIKGPDNPYRDYYLWSDENPQTGGRPNNWGSFFGGSVWEKDPGNTSQYFFHLFDKRMPDLNWKNPVVRQALAKIAKFWIDQGVDGLRLDAFIHLAKADFSQQFPTKKPAGEPVIAEPYFAHLPAVQKYLREFCTTLKNYKPDLFIIGEAASADVHLSVDYTLPENHECDSVITFRSFVDDERRLDQTYDTTFQPKPMDIIGYKQNVAATQSTLAPVSRPALYWSNHDMARVMNRYGDKDYATQSAKALATLMYLQSGIPIIYYGEELGLSNLVFNSANQFGDASVDRFICSAVKAGLSQDAALDQVNQTHKMAARGPMQWNDGPYHGFSNHQPWKYGKTTNQNAQAEERDSDSILNYYRKLLALKKHSLFEQGQFVMLEAPEHVFAFARREKGETAKVFVNLSKKDNFVDNISQDRTVMLENGDVSFENNRMKMSAWSVIVFQVNK